MITAFLSPGHLRVVGHAGGEKGRDIVCAGVSALVGTLRYTLSAIDPGSSCRVGPGLADIRCTDKGAAAMAFCADGIRLIAQGYPEQVRTVTQ